MGFYLGKFLYGSQNYSLDNENSDKDYKFIAAPSAKDLYEMRDVSGKIDDNNTIMDIRKFARLVLKGNLNIWELVFSVEKEFYSPEFEECINFAAHNSQQIIAASPGFLSSWEGITYQCGHNVDARKGCARTIYFIELMRRLVDNELEMTWDVWHTPSQKAIDTRNGVIKCGNPEDFSQEIRDLKGKFLNAAANLTIIPNARAELDNKIYKLVMEGIKE